VLLEERFAASRLQQAPPRVAPALARPSTAALLVAGAVALAALSLLLPSAPTYDPWAWIIWGREIAHLDLSTTDGPSWKPLPVAFTTVFSVFGSAAPDLWLVVARAGAIAAVFLAFRVARRLGGGVAGGVAAAAALAIAPWWIRNAALGNSEGLIVAFVLAAIDRQLDGRPRGAFLLAACAALLRPEAWPFLAAFGLWLLWRRALPARLVLGVGAGVLALWILPEWWGSGDPLRAAHRAKDVNPGAPTYADNPALEVLRDAGEMLTAPLLAGLAAAAGLVALRPAPLGRALAAATVVACAALTLWLRAENRNEDFRGASERIRAEFRAGDRIHVVTGAPEPFSSETLRHYLRDRADLLAALVPPQEMGSALAAVELGEGRLHVVHRSLTGDDPPLGRLATVLAPLDRSPRANSIEWSLWGPPAR
jgi:hypothetical protein